MKVNTQKRAFHLTEVALAWGGTDVMMLVRVM